MIENPSAYLRHVRDTDRAEFIELMRASKDLHAPWITPPTNFASFNQYMMRTRTDDHEGFVIARYLDDQIVGVINLNNVVRGSFLSASLGYYVGAPYVGQGFMAEGLELVKHYAFKTMNLHRLEANIQPTNTRSIALVQREPVLYSKGCPKIFYSSTVSGAITNAGRAWMIETLCYPRQRLYNPTQVGPHNEHSLW